MNSDCCGVIGPFAQHQPPSLTFGTGNSVPLVGAEGLAARRRPSAYIALIVAMVIVSAKAE